jgi:hypothetical protein
VSSQNTRICWLLVSPRNVFREIHRGVSHGEVYYKQAKAKENCTSEATEDGQLHQAAKYIESSSNEVHTSKEQQPI